MHFSCGCVESFDCYRYSLINSHLLTLLQGRFSSCSLTNFSKNGSLAVQTQHSALTQMQNSSDGTGSREIYSSSWIHSPGTLEEVSSNLVVGNDELDSGDDINKNEDCSNPLTNDAVSLTNQEIACLQQLRDELNLEVDDSGYSQKDISSPWNASSMEMLQSNLSTLENGFSNQEILPSSLHGSKYHGQDQHRRENVKNLKNLNIDVLHQNPGGLTVHAYAFILQFEFWSLPEHANLFVVKDGM